MTNVQHQNKSFFLDLLQVQIFQRFRFDKQTKLDHSEELIGDFGCQTHRSQGLSVMLKITPHMAFSTRLVSSNCNSKKRLQKTSKQYISFSLAVKYSNDHLYSI